MTLDDGASSGGGKFNKFQNRNQSNGQFISPLAALLNGKNNQKNKDGMNKGLTCGWINQSDFDKTSDNEEKHRRVKAVYSWYDRFVRGFPKEIVSELANDPANKYVAWEVQSVLAQVRTVYARAEQYLKEAESAKYRLDSLNPPPSIKDANNDMVFNENNPLIEQLFRLDKLKYANLYLLSILSGLNAEKLKNFAERWVQKFPELRTQRVTPNFVSLQYDPWYDRFFAHYGYEGQVSPPVVSVQFQLPTKTGVINDRDDCHGYPYQKVQAEQSQRLITIVAPIFDGDNLWSLFKNRPLTQRRRVSNHSSRGNINDPFAPSSYGGTLENDRKAKAKVATPKVATAPPKRAKNK